MSANRRIPYPLTIFAGAVAVFLSQIAAWRWNEGFRAEFLLLNYGSETLIPSLLGTLAGMFSGFVLALMLPFERREAGLSSSPRSITWVLSGLIPLLALVLKFLIAAGVRGLANMFFPILYVVYWAIYSQVPALWLGFVVGVLVWKSTGNRRVAVGEED